MALVKEHEHEHGSEQEHGREHVHAREDGSAGESRHEEVGEGEVKAKANAKHPVLPREEFDPGKLIHCATRGDPRGEA